MILTLKSRYIVFLASLGLSILVWWHPLFRTLSLSLYEDEYFYIALILPLSAMLIFMDRRWQGFSHGNVRTGCAVILTALAVGCCGRFWAASMASDTQLSISMFVLVLLWIGIFVLCFGIKAVRTLVFPLVFLFGLIPIPHLALGFIIAQLQNGSAWSAHGLFAAFGVPVLREGTQLTIPGLTVQVAPECSSIRSSSVLLVTAAVMAHVLLCATWKKALVIGIVFPLSVFKNGLRVFTIAMLGTHVDRGYLNGRLHRQGGVIFLAIALLIVFFAIWLLRKGERIREVSPALLGTIH